MGWNKLRIVIWAEFIIGSGAVERKLEILRA
jgi:hypothetical protein